MNGTIAPLTSGAITLKAFFGFKRHPFPPSCAPEPLFRSEALEAGLRQAHNALQSRLHVLLTAPAGLGKSSFCRMLMAELNPRDFRPLYVVGQPIGLSDLLRQVAEPLGLESSSRRGKAAQLLSEGLEKIALGSGPHPVLVLDEAQQLPLEGLEFLRLLAESHSRTMLTLVLVATDVFTRLLARPALSPLAGRLALRLRIAPLTLEDAEAFIEHAFTTPASRTSSPPRRCPRSTPPRPDRHGASAHSWPRPCTARSRSDQRCSQRRSSSRSSMNTDAARQLFGEPAINPLRTVQVAELPPEPARGPAWLIEDLWTREAVGLIGGAPKSCKTYLALEIAVAVASGKPCLGRFPVHDPGGVLLFAAEDAPAQLRDRIEGLAQARGTDFERLPVFLILAEQIRLDDERDKNRLLYTVLKHRPRLLILDPFVRLHRADENSATEVSRLLADLRALQRRAGLAVLLVHHTRKGNGPASGQALRGSSDLHAWGDSNLYLKKMQDRNGAASAHSAAIRLSVEHRAARAPEPMTLSLTGEPARLEITASQERTQDSDLNQLILRELRRSGVPTTRTQLRARLKIRNQSLTTALRELEAQKRIIRVNGGWSLATKPDEKAEHPSPDLLSSPRSVPTLT